MSIFDFLKKKEESEIASPEVVIEIKRLMANTIPATIAVFTATQERDESYNLQYVASQGSFKEDVSIVKDKFIESLAYKLNIAENLSIEQKLDIVKKKIDSQQKLIKDIKKGELSKNESEENKEEKKDEKKDNLLNIKIEPVNEEKKTSEMKNIHDEETLLNYYQALEFSIQNAGEGSYEEFDLQGRKKLVFTYIDGLFYPNFNRAPTNKGKLITIYPDIVTKKKHYTANQAKINEEWLEEQKPFFSGAKGILITIVIALMVMGNIFWSMRNVSWSQDNQKFTDSGYFAKLNDMAQSSAIKCSYYLSNVIPYIQEEMITKGLTLDEVINQTKPSTPQAKNI